MKQNTGSSVSELRPRSGKEIPDSLESHWGLKDTPEGEQDLGNTQVPCA